MIITLLIAGNETTVNLISNGMFVLFQHPEQLEMLKKDPTLIKSALDEILRYRGAVTNESERWVQEDFEFRGHQFKRGDLVYISIASANRDASHCPHAETFDITRENNKHYTVIPPQPISIVAGITAFYASLTLFSTPFSWRGSLTPFMPYPYH